MLQYQAPQRDIEFLLFELFRLHEVWPTIPNLTEIGEDLSLAVTREAGRLAAEIMAPLNQSGDAEGCTWDQGVVSTPGGFKDAYQHLTAGGWLGLSGNPEYGGQGMPKALGTLVEEMFWAANTSLYLYGTLTAGACICIDAHGTEEQKAMYLPKLYSGEWSGAMALTEAHAGTDLGIMRTRAEPASDGSYRITGSKIFITSGEHDLAPNIIHLVLAKLPDAPDGSKGLSLFIVPKFLPDPEGGLGERNGWSSGAIEHKMGINGSATNLINYDGAAGYLVGAENQGLSAMFTMMNYERLSVGIQGLGAGELAYQQAVRYARDRRQGRAPTGPMSRDEEADVLLVHPDVRRMLLTMRALTEAGRAFAVYTGLQLDLAKHRGDPAAAARAELLTPVAKAFLTDRGLECAVLAQQVLGGHGYVREWGVEQIVRDARIGQIYEGTNGIQALDLVGRKVLRDGGAVMNELLADIETSALGVHRQPLLAVVDRLRAVTASLVTRSEGDPELPGAVATDYLDLVGYTVYGWFWAQMAEVAHADEPGKRQLADFYFARLLPRSLGLAASVAGDAGVVMNMGAEVF